MRRNTFANNCHNCHFLFSSHIIFSVFLWLKIKDRESRALLVRRRISVTTFSIFFCSSPQPTAYSSNTFAIVTYLKII